MRFIFVLSVTADAAGESPAIQSLSADAASKRGCGGRDVRDPEWESATSLTSNIASWYLFVGRLDL